VRKVSDILETEATSDRPDAAGLTSRVSAAGFQVSQAVEGLELAAGLLRTAEELAGDADRRRAEAEEALGRVQEQNEELGEMLAVLRSAQADAEERAVIAHEHARAAEDRLRQALERTFALEAQLEERGRQPSIAIPQPQLTVIVDGERDELREALAAELRRPLSSIQGVALALKHADPGSKDGAGMIRQLGASARRLERLVAQMIELDGIANGTFVPKRRHADLKAIVRRVVEETADVADREVRVDAEHVSIAVDPALTEQMIESLLTNAARRTGPGGQVWVHVSSDQTGAVIAVDDASPEIPAGVPGAAAGSGKRSARRKGARAATGLALLSRLAELHGGRAWVEERPGGGASFRVFLPNASQEPLEDAPDAGLPHVESDDEVDDVVVDATTGDELRELSSFDDLSDELAI
jgi:signal transduction histidine kinase